MNKDFKAGVSPCEVDSHDLELINRLTVKKLSADDIFTFSVVLCDNEIDRDFERFDNEALQKIAEIFVGVTGISDHNPKSENQSSRIYAAECVAVNGKTTSYGEQYRMVKAKAYMPRTDKNKDLITEILAGIKKEVSVSCAVGKFTCSVCGEDVRRAGCSHRKGSEYSGKVCHWILSDIFDAYEWSFVAVPAQVNAGVTKSYKKESLINMESCIKSIKNGKAVNLNEKQVKQLGSYIENLEKQAEDGKAYRRQLVGQIVKYAVLAVPSLKAESVSSMCSGMEITELIDIKQAFMKKAGELIPVEPQLKSGRDNKSSINSNYKF